MFDLIFVCVIFGVEIVVLIYIYLLDKYESKKSNDIIGKNGHLQVRRKHNELNEVLLSGGEF